MSTSGTSGKEDHVVSRARRAERAGRVEKAAKVEGEDLIIMPAEYERDAQMKRKPIKNKARPSIAFTQTL